jgi:hypothetical protein
MKCCAWPRVSDPSEIRKQKTTIRQISVNLALLEELDQGGFMHKLYKK